MKKIYFLGKECSSWPLGASIATIVSRLIMIILLLGITPFNIRQQCSIYYQMLAFKVVGERHIISFGIWIMTRSPFITFLSCQPHSMDI
jgi:Na+-driven multidrug efflux pump